MDKENEEFPQVIYWDDPVQQRGFVMSAANRANMAEDNWWTVPVRVRVRARNAASARQSVESIFRQRADDPLWWMSPHIGEPSESEHAHDFYQDGTVIGCIHCSQFFNPVFDTEESID